MTDKKTMDPSKVLQLQTRLKAPKSARNTFGNYNYRNLESILEAAKPLLSEIGLLLHITDELVLVGDRYYIKATARLFDINSTEACLSSDGWAREAQSKKGMDESQITGSASSYARKIAVGSLLLIDDTKDADDLNKSEEYTEPAKQEILTANQLAQLDNLLLSTGTDLDHMMQVFKIKTVDSSNFDKVIKKLSEKLAVMKTAEQTTI